MSNKMAKREEKPFEFPKTLLNSIDECSAGGFLLFTINESGQIEPFMSFNSEITARAITDYCGDFAKSFKEINNAGMISSMSETFDSEEEDEDSDLGL